MSNNIIEFASLASKISKAPVPPPPSPSATPATLGLTLTQISDTWGDLNFEINPSMFADGTFRDDFVGSVIDGSNNNYAVTAVDAAFDGLAPIVAGDYYLTSNIELDSASVTTTESGDVNFSLISSVTTFVGVEYVYQVSLGAETAQWIVLKNTDTSPFYVRFWDSNPS
jgi:hypothetical protein